MKFARLLRTTAEDLPELQCLFQIYKHLKKQLKQLPARADGKASSLNQQQQQAKGGKPLEDTGGEGAGQVGQADANEEARFTAVLTDHLQRLNDRFLEREETCVIQLERLEAEAAQFTVAARAAAAETAGMDSADLKGEIGSVGTFAALKAVAEQRAQLYKRFVNFHGEVLLLVHWSVLAYTATVKILKKHHKRTGLLLRAPQLADLLSQPFCSSELMTGLARKAEACIQRLAEQLASTATSDGGGATTTGGAVTGEAGAAGCEPQETVEQVVPARGCSGAATAAAAAAIAKNADAATAAAAAAEAVDAGEDSYADGSSPSCSQSMSEGPPRIRRTWAEGAGTGALAGVAAASHADAEQQQRQVAYPSLPPQQQQERPQWWQRQSLPEQRPPLQADNTGGGGAGGGATFLRNLARLSDNASAASLSGPYVLEQLVELQQYVDEYDMMNEDDDDPEEKMDIGDDDEEEEDSGTPAAGGQGLLATAAAVAERSRGGCGAAAGPVPSSGIAGAAGGSGANGVAGLRPIFIVDDGTGIGTGAETLSLDKHHDGEDMDADLNVDGQNDHVMPRMNRHPVTIPLSPSQLEGQSYLQPGDVGPRNSQGATDGSGSGSGSGQGSASAAPAQITVLAAAVTAAATAATASPAQEQPSGSGADTAAPAAAAPPPPPAPGLPHLQQSSSGSAGAAGGAGSISIAISEAFGATRPPGAPANLLRRTQVALTMWEQLRMNASTPSTVIDPAGGPQGRADEPKSKRRRRLEVHGGGGEGALVDGTAIAAAAAATNGPRNEEAEESVGDDSGSNSD